MRNGAIALAHASGLAAESARFAEQWSVVHAELYPHYLAGQLNYEEMCCRRIWQVVDPGLTREEALLRFDVYMKAYRSAWTAFADAVPCLNSLRGFRLGVISNGRSKEQRDELRLCGLTAFFQFIAVSEEIGVAKPDPAIFRLTCAAMEVAPANALFIGDNIDVDYEGARKAGLRAIWLDRLQPGMKGSITRVSTLTAVAALVGAAGT